MPKPATIEMLEASDEKYVIDSALEIAFVLRQIRDRNALVTAYPGRDGGFFVTTILDVNSDGGFVLDCAPSAPLNARAADGNKIAFVTMHERVQVHFSCAHAVATMHDGRPALRCPPPHRLIRLQRRDSYRLTTPVLNPLKCVIRLNRDGPPQCVALRVLDISCGGIAMGFAPEGLTIDPGEHYPCTIELPGTGPLHATIMLRSAVETTLANGVHTRRAGCQFIEVSEKALGLVQRYILQQQRTRRTKAGGSG